MDCSITPKRIRRLVLGFSIPYLLLFLVLILAFPQIEIFSQPNEPDFYDTLRSVVAWLNFPAGIILCIGMFYCIQSLDLPKRLTDIGSTLLVLAIIIWAGYRFLWKGSQTLWGEMVLYAILAIYFWALFFCAQIIRIRRNKM